MSGAYMVSRQDGSERQSATCSLILDWYFPDSLIDTSNNRISLNILFDDDRSNSHAVYTAKTSWKGGDLPEQWCNIQLSELWCD